MKIINSISILSIVGILTIIFSTLVKIVGYPNQIFKNFKQKSTKGLLSSLIILSFLSYFFWCVYGILRKDLVVIVGHSLGVVVTSIVLFQIIKYRTTK